jgi:hypothetical protein
MSAFLYGEICAQREAAPAGTSKDENPPGFGSYVDIVAALVPAEILAANAVLLPLAVETATNTDGAAVTTVEDPGSLQLIFWLSLVASVLLYVIGDRLRARKAAAPNEPQEGDKPAGAVPWGGWNYVRALIPAGAYVVWTMLQKSTAFDAVAPDMEEAPRMIIAVFAALLLGATAKVLSDKADSRDPDTPEPEPEPGQPPVTEGVQPVE